MNEDTKKESMNSGSSYRPYYSYAPKQDVSAAASATVPSVAASSTASPASTTTAAASASAASVAPKPPLPKKTKSKSKGFLIAAASLCLIFMLMFSAVFAVTLLSTGSASGNKIAVIHIEGPMYSGNYNYGSGAAGSEYICSHIRAAANDNSVKAIVLRINSTGGTGSSSQEINMEIKRAQEMGKPVVTSVGDYAASAAYHVASQTDYIYASPSATTGSIGAIGRHIDNSQYYEENGVVITVFKSGEMKDMTSDYRELTEEEKRYWQHIIDTSFNSFVNDVAEGRGMTRNEVLKLADGRIYLASDAKSNGLIDDFGNLYTAADKAAELAGIRNYVLYYPESVTLSSLLF